MTSWLVVDLRGVVAHFRPERRLATLADETGLSAGYAVDDIGTETPTISEVSPRQFRIIGWRDR